MSRNYYCSTNLELVELFRHEDSRKETYAQQVELENELVGDFNTDNTNSFHLRLVNVLADVIDIVINDKGIYKDKLTHIRSALENNVNDINNWHKVFIPTTFEYILGIASKHKDLRRSIATHGWPSTVDKYKSAPNFIVEKGNKLNFKDIFCDPIPEKNTQENFNSPLLNEVYNAGASRNFGEDIAEIINDILKPSGRSIVETDPELARLLAVMAKNYLGRELSSNEVIWDPCAGSGRLLTSLEPAFDNVQANQIWANEIEPRFKEPPLSLRLGLRYIDSLTPQIIPPRKSQLVMLALF